ncbi:hypothetical protein [Acidovorax sp. SDU_ACID1]|uniref:hypothetical protein n=1 Tax=Acidovorax sp. SDU_ACID1 TaxID=3136632 RepID=UPI003872AF21
MSDETTLPPGIRRETNIINAEDVNRAVEGVAQSIIDVLNEYSKQHGATNALFGCLYAAGVALACYDAVLDESVDLRVQLSPLFEGYENQIKAQAH